MELKTMKYLDKAKLVALFHSVQWESAHFPDDLHKAIAKSDWVVTAWDNERLVGFMNAIADGGMVVYYPYVLVDPAYQGKGVGRMMMDAMQKRYSAFRTQVLASYHSSVPFYEKCGFQIDDFVPMFRYNMGDLK